MVTTTYSQSALPTANAGKAVSFTSEGALQVGAGTTFYNDVLSSLVGTGECAGSPSLAGFANNVYLLSYTHSSTQTSTLKLLQVSNTKQATLLFSLASNFFIYEVVPLDEVAGSFLAICQDFSDVYETAYLVLGYVSASQKTITLVDSSKTLYTTGFSADPSLVVLSSSSFALAYYTSSPSDAVLRYGTIDVTTPKITLYDPTVFADDSLYSITFSVVPLTATSLLAFYYNSSVDASTTSGPLQGVVAWVENNGSIALGSVSSYPSAQVVDFLAASSLTNTSAVVVYSNVAAGYSLQAQVVTVPALQDGDFASQAAASVVFGSRWTMNNGPTFYVSPSGILPDIDVVTLPAPASTSHVSSFAVVYSDLSNSYALTMSIGCVGTSGEVGSCGPDFVLYNPPAGKISTTYLGSALAQGVTSTGGVATQTGLISLVTNTANCSSAPIKSTFNLLHRLPGPAGLTVSSSSSSSSMLRSSVSSSSSSSLSLAVTGSFEGVYSTLVPGKVYYTNTLGSLVESTVYFGSTSSEVEGYVVDSANNAFVSTADGRQPRTSGLLLDYYSMILNRGQAKPTQHQQQQQWAMGW
eukprot:scaffold1046_cov162-Ochromonas_danica.AAC.8